MGVLSRSLKNTILDKRPDLLDKLSSIFSSSKTKVEINDNHFGLHFKLLQNNRLVGYVHCIYDAIWDGEKFPEELQIVEKAAMMISRGHGKPVFFYVLNKGSEKAVLIDSVNIKHAKHSKCEDTEELTYIIKLPKE